MRLSQIERIAPLSPVQQGLLFHLLAEPHAEMYVEHAIVRLDGPLDVDLFRRAWQFLIVRHDALRAAFLWRGLERPVQIFYRDVAIAVDEGITCNAGEIERWTHDRAREHARLAGDLSHPPLMWMALARVSATEHHVVWSIHHLIHDAWSLSILLNELMAVYAALARDRSPQLPQAGSYADFVGSMSNSVTRSSPGAERFWRQTLDRYTPPVAMTIDESIASRAASRHERIRRTLSLDENAQIEQRARETGVTLNTYAVAAWALALADRDDCRDIVFGTTTAGRPSAFPLIDRTVGVFINTLPFRARLDSQGMVSAWLLALQRRQLEMLEHEGTPLADISGWMAYPRQRPLFEAILVCQNALERFDGRTMADVRIGSVSSIGHPHYPLMCRVTPSSLASPTLIEIVFDTARVDGRIAERLIARVHQAFRLLPLSGDSPLGDLLQTPVRAAASVAAALAGARRKPVARIARAEGEVAS